MRALGNYPVLQIIYLLLLWFTFFFTKIEILLQFVELTCTDEMLAQFYLQDRDWNVERSVQAYFDEKTAKTEASRFADAIYLLLYVSRSFCIFHFYVVVL